MNTIKTTIAVTLALSLGACAAHNADIDNAKCVSYGAAPGTPSYIACRTQLDAARTSSVTTCNKYGCF